jgi:valyl-tRNA synthetase
MHARSHYISDKSQEAYEKATKLLGCSKEEIVVERDPDVLDTWFSSGLFPFSVFGWPEQTEDLKAFYPTSLLETGSDILFFWVARMVMMGLELTDQLPFHTVYLHAMVRDKEGRKMSKSLGNVIDPLEVINGIELKALLSKLDNGNLPEKEVIKAKKDQSDDFPDGIPECGSDALRFGLLAYTVQGRDINLDIKRVVGYRQFCNKIWNATRFALQFVTDFKPTPTLLDDLMSSGKMAIRDKFMISRLMTGVETVNDNFGSYAFGDAQHTSYSLWLNDLCDVYLELVKPTMYDTSEENKDAKWAAQATLWITLEAGLRLLHPMMPFVTEELWQRLPGRGTLGPSETVSIMLARYPECNPAYKSQEIEDSMEVAMKVVKACRSLRSSYNIANKQLTQFFVTITGPGEASIKSQIDDIKTLGKASFVSINPDDSAVPEGVGLVVIDNETTVKMDLTGLIDFAAEIKKLEKSLKQTTPAMTNLEKKIAAPGYAENVDDELKASNVEKLEGLKKKASDIEDAIAKFKKLEVAEKK